MKKEKKIRKGYNKEEPNPDIEVVPLRCIKTTHISWDGKVQAYIRLLTMETIPRMSNIHVSVSAAWLFSVSFCVININSLFTTKNGNIILKVVFT